MKTLFALFATLVSFASLSSAQAATYSYTCECRDTGYECDGGEYMLIDVNAKSVKWAMAYKPGDVYDQKYAGNKGAGKIDPNYSPRTNKGFSKFKTTSKVNPFVLVESGMIGGSRSGYVKKPEYNEADGQYGHTWEYECSRD